MVPGDVEGPLWYRSQRKHLVNGRTIEFSHGGALGLDDSGPRGVEHHWLTADQTLDVMLDKGEIDVYTALRPGPVTTGDTTVIDR